MQTQQHDSCPLCGGDLHVPLGVIYHRPSNSLISSTYSIKFSASEATIFETLWRRRNVGSVSHGQMLDCLYGIRTGGGPGSQDRVIKVHVCRIRRKLAEGGATDINIVTDRHCGYRLTTIKRAA